MPQTEIVVHGITLSGHTHRVVLLLQALGLPFRLEPADGTRRRSEEFLAMNPLGQIPVIEDGATVLADSNAIMVYLVKRYAPGSPWLPDDPAGAAAVQRWLSIAAGEIRFGPSAARASLLWGVPGDPIAAAGIARRLLDFMELHLADRAWLAADHVTLADLACYAYVAHAPEGGIPLDPYPAVRRWIAAVEAQPWFTAMPASPLPQPA